MAGGTVGKVRKYLTSGMLAAVTLAGAIAGVANGTSGGVAGGGGISGCGGAGWTMDTCYGATWKWYAWPSGAEEVQIAGKASSSGGDAEYAQSTTVYGCADYGGYWRYAMVAYGSASLVGGGTYGPGEQVGVIGIDANKDSVYDSEKFGGGMKYIPPSRGGGNWDAVRDEYIKLRKEEREKKGYNTEFPYEWDENDAYAGHLSWFCGPENVTDLEYLASSQVSNRGTGYGGADWKSTGIVSSYKTASEATTYVSVGEEATITFSHNVYATRTNTQINWSVARTVNGASGFENSAKYDLTPSSSTAGNGLSYSSGSAAATATGTVTTGTTAANSIYYFGEPRNYTDGENSFVLRDFYTIKFKATGTYNFCETLSIGSDKKTQVCSKVVVSNPGGGGGPGGGTTCQTWASEAGFTGSYSSSGYGTGVTSVLSRVNNAGSGRRTMNGTYSGWRGTVNVAGENSGANITYAEPGDTINWKNCYYPGVQYYYNSQLVYINGDPGNRHGAEHVPYNTTNYPAAFSSLITWNNKFWLATSSPYGFNNGNILTTNGLPTLNREYGAGVTTIQEVNNNYLVAKKDDVGKKYDDKITTAGSPNRVTVTNTGTHPWTGPDICGSIYTGFYPCPHSHTNVANAGTSTSGELSSQAFVKIPFNYTNEAGLTVSTPTAGLVYAGETINVDSAWVNVKVKPNALVEDTYATQVKNAEVKLMAYTSTSNSGPERTDVSGSSSNFCGAISYLGTKQCEEVNSMQSAMSKNVLNSEGYLDGTTDWMSFNGTYNVFDASAGDYFCFVMAVYPAASGADDNLSADGTGKWYVSAPTCRIIAKKPSFQVYGGSFYSQGSVQTSVASKRNIYNVYPYAARGASNTTIFGSWVEQSVVSLGTVNLLASGAGTGLTSDGAGSGSHEGGFVDFCKNRTALSFANYGEKSIYALLMCPTQQATGNAGISSSTLDRASLVSYWVPSSAATNVAANATVNLGSDYTALPSATGRSVRYTYGEGNLTVNGAYLGADTTHVVRTSGDVTIAGDITYADGSFTSAGQIPKLVIYASNITINCDVNEVDGILIAAGNVNTCPSSGDVNAADRARKLTIRGMVIASSMSLNRTYGAAMGGNSGEPAEAINYDTSAILWGRYMAGAAESDTLTVTYQHELAPRY